MGVLMRAFDDKVVLMHAFQASGLWFATMFILQTLKERDHLNAVVVQLPMQIAELTSKMNTLRREARIIKDHWADIKANRSFTYEIEEPRVRKVDLGPGKIREVISHATRCWEHHCSCMLMLNRSFRVMLAVVAASPWQAFM